MRTALVRALSLVLALSLVTFAAEPKPAVPVTALAFSPDGKVLVSGGYKSLLVWDPASGKFLRKVGKLSGQVRAIAFGKDGATVAVADGVPGRSGSVSLVDLETGALTLLQQAKDEMLAVAWSADGKYLATGGTDAIVRIFTLETKTGALDTKAAAPDTKPGALDSNAPAPDTKPGALATKVPPIELKGHTDWISGLAFSPDGKLFVSGSADRTARLWKTETWKQEFQLPLQITEAVNAVAFAPEGDLLAFATGGPDERAIRIWRTQGAFTEIDPARPGARNALMQTRPLDTGACLPLAVTFSKGQPHSRLLVGCTDNTMRITAPAGNVIATATGHAGWVYAVAASPDGLRMASGSGDGTVKIWGPPAKLLFTLSEGTTQP